MTPRPSTLPLDFVLAAVVEHLAEVRQQLAAWLLAEGIEGTANSDLLSVATEFFLHVVVKTGGVGCARVVAERTPRGVRMAVTAATAVAPIRRIDLPPDPLETGSIGRRLVDGCCDDLQISEVDGSIGVQCWRAVQSA